MPKPRQPKQTPSKQQPARKKPGRKKPVRAKKKRAGGGGPQTAAGKARARLNAMRHGLRSNQCLILPDETAEEYQELRAGWLLEFEPESFGEKTLVEEVIRAHWLLKRAQRRLIETEFVIAGEDNLHPVEWGSEEEHKVELMHRYKTSAERSFHRAMNAARHLRKDNVNRQEKLQKRDEDLGRAAREQEREEAREAQRVRRKGDPATGEPEEAKSRAEQLFQGQQAPKKRKKLVTLEQWVEIETTPEGETLTTLYPTNPELIKRGQQLWPAPTLVVRRLNFVGGVPREYEWALEGGEAADAEQLRTYGGCGLQRIEVEDWLELIEAEAQLGTGHLLPVANLPRPQERGGCECPVCTHNQQLLDEGDDDDGNGGGGGESEELVAA